MKPLNVLLYIVSLSHFCVGDSHDNTMRSVLYRHRTRSLHRYLYLSSSVAVSYKTSVSIVLNDSFFVFLVCVSIEDLNIKVVGLSNTTVSFVWPLLIPCLSKFSFSLQSKTGPTHTLIDTSKGLPFLFTFRLESPLPDICFWTQWLCVYRKFRYPVIYYNGFIRRITFFFLSLLRGLNSRPCEIVLNRCPTWSLFLTFLDRRSLFSVSFRTVASSVFVQSSSLPSWHSSWWLHLSLIPCPFIGDLNLFTSNNHWNCSRQSQRNALTFGLTLLKPSLTFYSSSVIYVRWK